ncbi:MAG TPA: sulfite exporter TauE/SafE family protein [Flexivirga sp.]|uniref:sulfite exporter TauE/SafE family protein n=1 Tax=Flexivirga sp. TaxID=1962927 RepID=UPI002C667EB7|nr:sulfite exporter TauE/SafE family protein [Flexivirga sp.]HWC24411.1 sulfite exporter TauE/SafE family protein [Flexivirga sp.]
MSITALVILSVTVIAAGFVQGLSGIGFALIFAPIAGLINPGMLPVTLLVLMLPLNAFVTWRERSAVDWHGFRWIAVARVASTPLGLFVLTVVPKGRLGLLIGAATVLAAVVSLITPDFHPSRGAFLGAGVATGLCETATGVGGPPLALVYQHAPAPQLRSTVAASFFLGELVSVGLLLVRGVGSARSVLDAAWLIPALVIGLLLSSRVHHRIDSKRLRLLVLTFALVSGVVLMLS